MYKANINTTHFQFMVEKKIPTDLKKEVWSPIRTYLFNIITWGVQRDVRINLKKI
mgnify:CR=1 FL=1|jgi:hypothetical protein